MKHKNPLDSIHARTKLTKAAKQQLALAYHAALETVLRYNDEQAWHTLMCSLTVAGKLADVGVYPECRSVVETAKDALHSTKAKGSYQLNVPDYLGQALLTAVKCHDEQIEQCSLLQFQTALEQTFNEIRE